MSVIVIEKSELISFCTSQETQEVEGITTRHISNPLGTN